jgi:hypothetical protein
MAIQTDIVLLLAARFGERQKEPYLVAQLCWTVIHHPSSPPAVGTLMVSVVESPLVASLMPASRCAKARPPRLPSTARTAVPISTVTAAAQEEHLAT